MAAKAKKVSEWQTVKIELEKASHTRLVKLIKALYEQQTDAKNFIRASLLNGHETLEVYKRLITNAIYLDTNDRQATIDFSQAKDAIADFKKANGDPASVLELMVHYVEIGTDQTKGICIDYAQYYDSLASMFRRIIKRLTGPDKQHAEVFRPRLERIIHNATRTGYGYQERIQEMFHDAFPG